MTTSVLVAGTYALSDAYPNVRFRIALLRSDDRLQVTEINRPLRTALDYTSRRRIVLSAAAIAWRMASGLIAVLLGIARHRRLDVLYVPYPAVHLLWILSLLPKRVAPGRIVADAFISLYDTIVSDRGLLRPGTLLAKSLFRLERRAFGRASRLVTDTPENSRFYARLFGIDAERFTDMPLSIDEAAYRRSVAGVATVRGSGGKGGGEGGGKAGSGPLELLFVGTFVPLHGMSYLCRALAALPPDLPLRLIIVGDGQEAPVLERFLAREPLARSALDCRWIRAWQGSDELIRRIDAADVCLGIFGAEGKGHRVWPFKNYLYLARGRPIITADTAVSSRLAATLERPAFWRVDPRDPRTLTSLVERLARRPEIARDRRRAAALCYETHLAEPIVRERLVATLQGATPTA